MNTSQPRRRDKNEPGHPTKFTTKDHSAPEGSLLPPEPPVELADIRLSTAVKEAAVTAAAGGHHALFVTSGESEGEVEQLVRAMAQIQGKHVVVVEPNVTSAELFGGGKDGTRGGLLAKAHGGILYIKNMPELDRSLLDALRQPMGIGRFQLNRSGVVSTHEADFQLVGTTEPCPCGGDGDSCGCTFSDRRRYRSRISGPVLDRIGIQTDARTVPATATQGRSSASAADMVKNARERQAARWADAEWSSNHRAPGNALRTAERRLPPAVTADLDRALERGGITLRGYDKVLRLAWTLADSDGASEPNAEHIERGLRMCRTLT